MVGYRHWKLFFDSPFKNSYMNVVIIGGSGLVGTNLVREFESRGHDVMGTYHSREQETTSTQLDKTDSDAVQSLVSDHDADVVVDTAAFHAVDDCEEERERAWMVNAQGTRNVAAAADTVDAHYIYLSTDYVFPGKPDETPYTEQDRVQPINYYAQTKYAGEQAAAIADAWTVLRSSVIYGTASDNFLIWVLDELRSGNHVDIVDDQISRPTYAPNLAQACVAIGKQRLTGLYHATGPKSLSRYEFTLSLAECLEMDTTLISPISTEEFGQEAPRPADSSLDSTHLYDQIGFQFLKPADAFEKLQMH